MEINFINFIANEDITAEDALYKATEITLSTLDRLKEEQPDVKITGAYVMEVSYKIGFKVEGVEEIQGLAVEHHPGVPEEFKWIVDYAEEENGEAKEVHNKDNSFMDAYTASVKAGTELEFEKVESVYCDVEMALLDTESYGNMSKDTWEHPEGFRVVMVYQNDRLIQEYKLTPKETE